jgi:hypothetical protein
MNKFLIIILALVSLIIITATIKKNKKNITENKQIPIEINTENTSKQNNTRTVSFSEQEDIRVFDPQMPPYAISDLNYGPHQMDMIDRIRNPLRYPYQSVPQFQTPIITENLPFQVIGAGRRNAPALNQGYSPMLNPPVSVNIGPQNIAPVNMSVRGGIGLPQQIGVITKIFGNENDVYPLYGRKRFPRDHKWDYYTTMGKQEVKLRVRNVNANQRFDELSSNDEVYIEGMKDRYRVIAYDTDFPQYI